MALQLRQVQSDKSLGLFWTGNTLSTVGRAKTYTSYRSAAKDQALASVANGIELEIVQSVSSQAEANTQNSSRMEILNSAASLSSATSTKSMIVSTDSQAFTNQQV